MKQFILPLLVISLMFVACETETQPKETEAEKRVQLEMQTTQGSMLIELYNETPKHRDNFLKLAEEGAFDSLLFHRVINDFMIQSGDPDSKYASQGDTLGNGDRDYKVDAEFMPKLFHKKGALGAARDGNMERASSAMQFYFAQGKVFNDSLLKRAEMRINEWSAVHEARKDPANKELSDGMTEAMEKGDMNLYEHYNSSLKNIGLSKKDFRPYQIPEEHIQVYKTIGGTPHLDQNYTVFGEVIEGIEVIDIIAAVPTDTFDRPVEDVRIISVKVLK